MVCMHECIFVGRGNVYAIMSSDTAVSRERYLDQGRMGTLVEDGMGWMDGGSHKPRQKSRKFQGPKAEGWDGMGWDGMG